MSRIVEDDSAILIMRARARVVPVASTIVGSALSLVPVVAAAPVMPPLGLMMFLGWRLLRPELWPMWIGLPLGMADDFLTGQPLGSAMTLWTMCMLLLDFADRRLIWRDYWQEWGIGALAIGFCLAGGVMIARDLPGDSNLGLILPQFVIAVLAFPAILRLCARLDKWRLA